MPQSLQPQNVKDAFDKVDFDWIRYPILPLCPKRG
jgi:hypothetical protein